MKYLLCILPIAHDIHIPFPAALREIIFSSAEYSVKRPGPGSNRPPKPAALPKVLRMSEPFHHYTARYVDSQLTVCIFFPFSPQLDKTPNQLIPPTIQSRKSSQAPPARIPGSRW